MDMATGHEPWKVSGILANDVLGSGEDRGLPDRLIVRVRQLRPGTGASILPYGHEAHHPKQVAIDLASAMGGWGLLVFVLWLTGRLLAWLVAWVWKSAPDDAERI